MDKINKSFFNLEINTTSACNMACDYCFEYNTIKETKKINYNLIVKRIDELLKDEWFNSMFSGIRIDFWGGEPTLNLDLIKKILKEYMENKRVVFHFYSNGYQMDKFYDVIKFYIEKYKNSKKIDIYTKFNIQFSYDGQPIHDMHRKDKLGRPTGAKIIKNTEKFDKLGFPVYLKSTIRVEDFKYMPQIWDEFEEYYNKFYKSNKWRFSYCPTINHFSNYYNNDFDKAIIEISKKEIIFSKNNNGKHLMSWFRDSKKICNAGRNMVVVDINNGVYFCHSILYNDFREELKITSTEYDTFVRDIQTNFEKVDLWQKEYNKNIDKECINCPSTICMKCNARKYEHSKKTKTNEKWMDFTCQHLVCDYFKQFGIIHRALKKIILEENENGLY